MSFQSRREARSPRSQQQHVRTGGMSEHDTENSEAGEVKWDLSSTTLVSHSMGTHKCAKLTAFIQSLFECFP